jgi:glycosyltransferase involved in cell wall biosynthesis
MHVAVLADPEIPVPPQLYGGIERIVEMLVHGLARRGHRVTLFAHPDSSIDCELVGWRGASSLSRRDTLRNALTFAPRGARFDVVHSFARLAYMLPILPLSVPKVQSYQRAVTPRSVRWGQRLSRGSLWFTACSANCAASGNVAGTWRVIPNGVPLNRYPFVASVDADAPLVFLGRIEHIKGTHHAIDIAQRTGRKLLIAGNLVEGGEAGAYGKAILERCDGERVRYVGPVDDAAKAALLGSAAALLFPIEWDEPFGIVMAEALACGTPVVAFPRGSVPEVVDHGVTGFICADVDAMTHAVAKLPSIDRANCRQAAAARFSADPIVDAYEQMYTEMIERAAQR